MDVRSLPTVRVAEVAEAERADLRPAGSAREVYLVAEPPDDQIGWVTQLQWPVERITG